MKFLLTAVNAKYIHSNPAIYSLRAYSASRDADSEEHMELAEYTINQSRQEILADIYRRHPDVIAFSCYIWNWDMIRPLIGELAKILPDVPIWLGGPEVSYDAPQILKEMAEVTGVMAGEGEQTFLELLRYYRKGYDSGQAMYGGDLADIAGIVYREDAGKQTGEGRGILKSDGAAEDEKVSKIGSIRQTSPRSLTDISALPFFYNKEDISDFANRIIYYESSRGCPYRCSYCLSSIDKTVRLRDPEMVKKELQFFLDEKVPQVKFVDRTFNCNHRHAMEIWNYLGEHDNGITNFHFEIAADILTKEELALLGTLRPGLVQLEIGVQSTNSDTLREIRRVMDWERLKGIVAGLQRGKNIHIHLDLIAGLPYENLESFRHSFNDVYSCRPQQLQLGFLKVLKGSYMHERAEEYGIVYTNEPPYEVLFTRWLSYEDVLVLKEVEEMVELYYNSGQFAHTLPELEACFPAPFDLYLALAGYYREQGHAVKSPSRISRYQVLLDFAVHTDPVREELYRQLLTLDLYLRENMKNRPEFALALPNEAEIKPKITAFYKKEEKTPTVLKKYVEKGYDSRQMARMTHLEYFPSLGEPHWLLFDYQERNPLNQDARTVEVEL